MGMPWQLARARRPKRSTPRSLVEQLARIDIADLCRLQVFPNNWYDHHTLEMPFRLPFAKSLVISRQIIEINHAFGYTQRIALKWVRTGFGGNRKPRDHCLSVNAAEQHESSISNTEASHADDALTRCMAVKYAAAGKREPGCKPRG